LTLFYAANKSDSAHPNHFVDQCRGVIVDTQTERLLYYPLDHTNTYVQNPDWPTLLPPNNLAISSLTDYTTSMLGIFTYPKVQKKGLPLLKYWSSNAQNIMGELKRVPSNLNVDHLDNESYWYIFYQNKEVNGGKLSLLGTRDKITLQLLQQKQLQQIAKELHIPVIC